MMEKLDAFVLIAGILVFAFASSYSIPQGVTFSPETTMCHYVQHERSDPGGDASFTYRVSFDWQPAFWQCGIRWGVC